MDYSEELIRLSAQKIGVDISKYDMEQVKMGMAVELEHGSKSGPSLNVTADDPVVTLKITLAHLEEDPEYYTKLAKVEERYKLTGFDTFSHSIEEDAPAASVGGPSVGATSLASVSGMGAPVLASRGVVGSGDVPSSFFSATKKKKKVKKVKSFSQFLDK